MERFTINIATKILKLKKCSRFFREAIVLHVSVPACFVLLCFPISSLNAQPADAHVELSPTFSGNISAVFYVKLPDSTGFTDVDIKLIDSLDDVVLFERNFVFDQTSGLPSGITWQRNGTEVNLGIGSHIQKIAYMGKVRLKNTAGLWSDWYEFLFN